jgi:diguanylate cyclase (GGDEF)-like protein
VLSLLCILLATAAAAWGYETYGRYSPGLAYQIEVTIVISTVLAPSFLYPIIVLASRLRRATDKLQLQATTDSTTGLPNTYAISQELSKLLNRASTGRAVALHFIDLDRFKEVNDTLGHAAGDELLRAVAGRLKSVVGERGLVGRFGGDEFIVVQRQSDSRAKATELATGLISALSAKYHVNGHDIHISATVGVAHYPEDGSDSPSLLRAADLALYRAKHFAKGKTLAFNRQMDEDAQRQRRLELDVRAALAAGQFQLHFQPLFCTKSLRITTCEALLRWRHPDWEGMSAALVVAAAERTGCIGEIGHWVLREACRACSGWPESVRVAINLSPSQFAEGDIVEIVGEALRTSGLAADRLELEITESVLLQDLPIVRTALEKLTALGVRISLDDFGSGYSGLHYLHRFRLDKVKIDRQFVQRMTPNSREISLLRGIARLCVDLDMTVAVEGIETEEQADLILQEDSIGEVQGFLFCRPLPESAISEILRATAPVSFTDAATGKSA